MIKSFFLGFGTAILTFGGIMLGVRLLLSLEGQETSKREHRKRLFFAIFVLIAQFLLAGALLYFSNLREQKPLPLAVGLILGIFGLYSVMRSFEKSSE